MVREENQTVEYKASWHEKYLEWICGYANAKGGVLYIGIEDGTKKPVGVANANKLMEDIPNSIRNTMGVVADVSLLKKQGRDVVRVKVQPSAYPVSYHGGYFYRTGSVKMQLVGNALTDFILRKTGSSWDVARNGSGKTVSEGRFTVLAGQYHDRKGNKLEDRDFQSFGLADDDGFLTNAGALFADDSPVYQNRLFCTRWNGVGRSAGVMDAMDSKEYSGSVLSLFEYGMNFVKMNSRSMWHKFPDRRVDFLEYPIRAVEEAVANALIHRDYTNYGSEVHIDIYEDRLEVVSPGGMFDGGVPIQDRPNLCFVGSARRNPIVADVFSRLDYAERRGSGLKKILDAYGAANYNLLHRMPTFASDTFFTVTLPSLTYGLSKDQLVSSAATPVMTRVATPVADRIDHALSARQKMILQTLVQGELSSSEIVSSVDGIAVNNLRRRYLRYLLDAGYVAYTLPDKPNSRLQKYRLTAKGKQQLVSDKNAVRGSCRGMVNGAVRDETIPPQGVTIPPQNETIPPRDGTIPLQGITIPVELARRLAEVRRRMPECEMKALIVALCRLKPMSVGELSRYLKRSEIWVKTATGKMVGRELDYLYPEMIHHPRQSYVAKPAAVVRGL